MGRHCSSGLGVVRLAPRATPRHGGALGPAHEERWAVSMAVTDGMEMGKYGCRGGGSPKDNWRWRGDRQEVKAFPYITT
jgi:hypothetical protein